ncbi:AraC family transcriptional regulator [Burkholderia sp. BCC1977]|uniref:AraC family transcriptional regulator n=1 Tax=Burkholderia sp. BCC1977 TaxID=2817440 RepID=UPI002ABD924A|nr:AraC family transcriptional regulator [Burkholderia sp. BCC1977]
MSEKMRHVAEWLSANFAESVRMRQAAALVAMSERSLLRNFTRETGVTPSAYLTQVRLARACAMLERTALPVDSIARRCGLGSGDYLAHLFRHRFDATPTEHRRARTRADLHAEGQLGACDVAERHPPDGDAGG